MSRSNRLWSMYDGEILGSELAGGVPPKIRVRHELTSSQSSVQRSISSSSSSSDVSTSSDCPLVPEKEKVKVPPHVAATLAHRGFDVDEFGKVTWRDNSRLHPRNWSTLRKLYDVSTKDSASSTPTDRVMLCLGCGNCVSGSVHNTSQQHGFLDGSCGSYRFGREQRNCAHLLHHHLSSCSGYGRARTASNCRNFRWSHSVHHRHCGFHHRMCLDGCKSNSTCGHRGSHYLWIHVCFTKHGRCKQL